MLNIRTFCFTSLFYEYTQRPLVLRFELATLFFDTPMDESYHKQQVLEKSVLCRLHASALETLIVIVYLCINSAH